MRVTCNSFIMFPYYEFNGARLLDTITCGIEPVNWKCDALSNIMSYIYY